MNHNIHPAVEAGSKPPFGGRKSRRRRARLRKNSSTPAQSDNDYSYEEDYVRANRWDDCVRALEESC
jgi:hypothetical protein